MKSCESVSQLSTPSSWTSTLIEANKIAAEDPPRPPRRRRSASRRSKPAAADKAAARSAPGPRITVTERFSGVDERTLETAARQAEALATKEALDTPQNWKMAS